MSTTIYTVYKSHRKLLERKELGSIFRIKRISIAVGDECQTHHMDPFATQILQGHILCYYIQDHGYSILVLAQPTRISRRSGHSVIDFCLAEGLNSITIASISELP
ncbi:hypothetical protein NPIL_388031 [Nephila pilipes]|uniref:Uncharacterized protein n=1 Tax=Nephila pilipes TaxID=299642 RepID=A0A8X6QRZ5_NEPPI|nr:hypothetical protein NPIL_388031 [Nephila pilipes]